MQIQQKLPSVVEKNGFYLLLFALLALLYTPLLWHWVDGWLNKSISIEHEYFSHGLIGLPFAAYIVWENRHKWERLRDRAQPLGAILLGLGASFYLTGISEWVNLSFPIVLTGLCLWLKGIEGLKLQKYALLFVLLATPNSIPYLITPYTLPLQTFIAGTAGFILIHLGIPVEVEGIYLTVGGKLVEVAPYCAGLKMLFTSLYVALMLLYWTDAIRSRRKTVLLLAGAATLSVLANIIRNTLLTFFHGTGRTDAFVWLHDSWGGDVYSACMLGLIVVLLKVIERADAQMDWKTSGANTNGKLESQEEA
ncbi:cyanoexosortase B [Lusitaniella coriacea LEGE 07157]|uniref:Cyanoexosortase B n=1 Tax=Lusitaniella coriacea LEGE 07157 TaxID=945747 RepID=A0A8J7IXC3_9CYAN|nr:cyanoexosortase B [Lusitaniella coriacea]MBE9118652.1 cyanoexosortase B [Lusitaniella coriacea LEGE 07157]